MKIDQITEDKVSAALHVANARHGQTLDRLQEILAIHKNRSGRQGQEISGRELINDIEIFIETQRLR